MQNKPSFLSPHFAQSVGCLRLSVSASFSLIQYFHYALAAVALSKSYRVGTLPTTRSSFHSIHSSEIASPYETWSKEAILTFAGIFVAVLGILVAVWLARCKRQRHRVSPISRIDVALDLFPLNDLIRRPQITGFWLRTDQDNHNGQPQYYYHRYSDQFEGVHTRA